MRLLSFGKFGVSRQAAIKMSKVGGSDSGRVPLKEEEVVVAPPADGEIPAAGAAATSSSSASRTGTTRRTAFPSQPNVDAGLSNSKDSAKKSHRRVHFDTSPTGFMPTGLGSEGYTIDGSGRIYPNTVPNRFPFGDSFSREPFSSSWSSYQNNGSNLDPSEMDRRENAFGNGKFYQRGTFSEELSREAEERVGNQFDQSQYMYGLNIHVMAEDVGKLGTTAFFRNYEAALGSAKARRLLDIARAVYEDDHGEEPPTTTIRGEQILAKHKIEDARERLAIGGSSMVDFSDHIDNPQLNQDINMDQEMTLTYARDHHNRPIFARGLQFARNNTEDFVGNEILGGDAEVYTSGGEKIVALLGSQLHRVFSQADATPEEIMTQCAQAFHPQNMEKIIEQGRRTDLKLEDKPSHMMEVPMPLLKGPGDRTGDANEKTIKELKSRLNDKLFSGQLNDDSISCRVYLETLRQFLQGRYNEVAAYEMFRATTKGRAAGFVENLISLKPNMRHFWRGFCEFFARAENPEEALMKLQNLRYDRPTDLQGRFCRMQSLAVIAGHQVPPQLRMKKIIELLREETFHMLGTWFPEQRAYIKDVDKRKALMWMTERKAFRRQGKDPDRELTRNEYHPWISLTGVVLTTLENIYPIERPRGFVPKRQAAAITTDRTKKKRKNGLFEIGLENGQSLIQTNVRCPTESEFIDDYAESIVSGDYDDSEDDQFDSECDPLSDVEELTDEGEADDPEVNALHRTPGEAMRRFADKPRPPRPDGRRDGRDGRQGREGRHGRDGNRRDKDVGANKRFPHKDSGDMHRLCACCGSRTHGWNYCGAYDGMEPVAEKRSCCSWWHPGACKYKEAKELDLKKKQRAMERGPKPPRDHK